MNEFQRKILKVDLSRNHKITNSIGSYDIYKILRKEGWINFNRPIKEKEYYTIIRLVNNYIAQYLANSKSIKLPHRLGTLELRKKPRAIRVIDNKVYSNLPIDWKSTLLLWEEDEYSKTHKKLIRFNIDYIFNVYWNKSKALFTNKTMTAIKINRELKKAIKDNIYQDKIDAYLDRAYY